MKRLYISFCFMLLCSLYTTQIAAQGVLQSVTVETYYVADDQDIQDAPDQEDLPAGSITYRVFVELAEGAQIRAIYGDENHPFAIESSEVFFNNSDRGGTFAWEIPDNRLDEYTVALDSWLSFAGATDEHWGILKTNDPDGSIIGGDNHEEGWLANTDQALGVPLIEADGIIPSESTDPLNFVTVGDHPETIFNDASVGNAFVSTNFRMQQAGFSLPETGNTFCVAQLTTAGELSFTINLEILTAQGEVQKYVGTEENLQDGELYSPFLKFPLECGCTDANFLEYSPGAGCDDGSCATPIVFGCNNPLACNYDPEVNLNIPELCCILPDNCEGLDQEAICPGAVNVEEGFMFNQISVYPNPFSARITLDFGPSSERKQAFIQLSDALGKQHYQTRLETSGQHELNLNQLEAGMYLLRVSIDGNSAIHRIIKQ